MKCYGRKQNSKICQCCYCKIWRKDATRKGSERQKAKARKLSSKRDSTTGADYVVVAKPSKPSFSKKFIKKMMKAKP